MSQISAEGKRTAKITSKQLKGAKPATSAQKRSYIKQSDIPQLGLAQALRVPQALYDGYAGKSAAPHEIAIALGVSPTSHGWDSLAGAALAYGLIEGGSHAAEITMTDLARRIIAPTDVGDDDAAKAEAVMRPRIIREFLTKYDKAKYPPENIALNVLATMGVPHDRKQAVFQLITESGIATGIIRTIKTGQFVAIANPVAPPTELIEGGDGSDGMGQLADLNSLVPPPSSGPIIHTDKATTGTRPDPTAENNRVFITHGKNKQIVDQLKEIVKFGKFVPVIAEEQETPSKPVPDKVMDEMRSCFAGIIHVASEERLISESGEERHFINQNVLIEIGAAMALYHGNFILLVQKGLHLPSNLQGLYNCYYEGDKLDGDATMKLLKSFNGFRPLVSSN